MSHFDADTISSLAQTLARNALRLHHSQSSGESAEYPFEEEFVGILATGVAAFLGRLLTLVPEQLDTMGPIIDRFFADPATAGALIRYAGGEAAAADDLAETLFTAGLAPSLRVHIYFPMALESLVGATRAAALHRPRLEHDEGDAPPFLSLIYPTLDLSEYLFADNTRFVKACDAHGLGRVELGQAIAADGETVLFVWEPVPMAGAPPPGELAESTPPEELAGETGSGEGLEATGESPPPPPPPSPAPAVEESEPPALGPSFPAPPDEAIVALRLDAALPERVTVGRAFDLAVAVRRDGSPPLAPADLARRESADFGALWPSGATFIQLRIQVSAPECDVHGGDSRSVRLLTGGDGPPVYFQLTPKQAGSLSVIITVYQEADWVGSTRLRTEAGAGEARGGLAMTVESRPLSSQEVNLVTLRSALDDGYNDSELRDLCFELGIDYEDLPGDNQGAKARELVLFAKRRGQIAQLVERVMKERPHLLVRA
jgi:hypothetical protein